ncbi:hypothetical protein B0H10DRAFT_2113122 [Mycena sp. CBHHK59/15]|nr:hypothetical protein B0H10DRAFT_2113122 [Mycena sp. CBHHK59/15]
MTTTFSKCGLDLVQAHTQTNSFPAETRRLHIRSRLAELNTLIAALTAERQSLQAESDSIMYPVLSLPPEITMEVFRCCLPSDSMPRPSPFKAPLLLAQICRQWRRIALNTPNLWRSLVFGDESSVEILKLWLSRAGNLPLNYSLHCTNPSRAGALIETIILHSHQWQDVSFGIPLTSFPKLDMRYQSLPMLRQISLDIHQRASDDAVPDTITIQNAPLLREVHISTLPDVKFDIPWHQLTTLTLCQSVDLMECISLLRECPGLVHLVVSTMGSAATHTAAPLTLNLLESFTSNLEDVSIMEHLTLPRLERLPVTGTVGFQHPTILKSFIRRSACALQFLSLSVSDIVSDTLNLCLRTAPASVVELELIWHERGSPTGALFNVLQPMDVLPQLKKLRFRGGRLFDEDYNNLVAMLHSRRDSSSGRAALDSLAVNLKMYSGLHNRRYMPKISTITQLRALAADGVKIKFTMSGRSNYSTHVPDFLKLDFALGLWLYDLYATFPWSGSP